MNISVLVVDDEAAMRENLSAYLEDEGMDVTTMESGERAVEHIKQGNRYDVCIMDMRLPAMDGNTAIMLLHALLPDLRFLVHTGSTLYSLPMELRKIGITDDQVFMKPLNDMKVLTQTIHQLIMATKEADQ